MRVDTLSVITSGACDEPDMVVTSVGITIGKVVKGTKFAPTAEHDKTPRALTNANCACGRTSEVATSGGDTTLTAGETVTSLPPMKEQIPSTIAVEVIEYALNTMYLVVLSIAVL